MALSLTRPSPGEITSGFGPRTPGEVGSTYHLGVDFGWGNGRTIYAAAAGTVTFAGWRSGYGYLTEIDHGKGYETRYGHQSEILVTVGQQVAAGEEIGVQGNTGTSAGTHLHFELRLFGVPLNPRFPTVAADDFTVLDPPKPKHRRKARTMLALLINDGRNLLGGGRRTYITGPGYWLETTGHPTADQVSVLIQGHDPDGKVNSVPNLTYRELYDYARASGGCPPEQLTRLAAAAGVRATPA